MPSVSVGLVKVADVCFVDEADVVGEAVDALPVYGLLVVEVLLDLAISVWAWLSLPVTSWWQKRHCSTAGDGGGVAP